MLLGAEESYQRLSTGRVADKPSRIEGQRSVKTPIRQSALRAEEVSRTLPVSVPTETRQPWCKEIATEAQLTFSLHNGNSQNRVAKPAAQSTRAQPSPATTRRSLIKKLS